MATSSTEWETRISEALRPCSDDSKRFFSEMRKEYEQFLTALGSAAGDRSMLAFDLLASIAQQVRAGTDRCLADLQTRKGLVERWAGGITMPLVYRAFRKRRSDAIRQRVRRLSKQGGCDRGVTGCDRGVTSHPNENTHETPLISDAQGVTSESPGGVTSPQVSFPPITPLSSFPPDGERGRAVKWAEARRFAVNYLSANDPTFLRSGKEPFASLVFQVGKEQALNEVRACTNRGVRNPYALALHRVNNPPEDAPATFQHKPQSRRAIGMREDN